MLKKLTIVLFTISLIAHYFVDGNTLVLQYVNTFNVSNETALILMNLFYYSTLIGFLWLTGILTTLPLYVLYGLTALFIYLSYLTIKK